MHQKRGKLPRLIPYLLLIFFRRLLFWSSLAFRLSVKLLAVDLGAGIAH